MRRSCRALAARALFLVAVAVLALVPALASRGSAATLKSGDVVALALESTTMPGILLHVDVASGVIDSIVPRPALATPYDVVVRGDGMILVADAALGLVVVEPASGAASVLAGPGAFGGFGPSTLAMAPGGDVLLAGAGGVYRLPAGGTVPQPVSGTGRLVNPRGIADDGAGGAWVSDQGNTFPTGGAIVHVGAGGAQATLATGCATNQFPVLPLQVRRGPDGFLYVVSGPYGGPTNYLNAGVFRVDPVSGVATMWWPEHFVRGFELAPGGGRWMLVGQDISRSPYGGILGGPGGQFYLGTRGPIALVPAGVTPTRTRTWGALKSLYR